METTLNFCGSDFCLSAADLSGDLCEAMLDCGGSGDAEPAVDFVLSAFDVTGEPDDCKAYLAGYGAWDDDELSDHDANLKRLVWLAGCSLSEDGEIYFSTY